MFYIKKTLAVICLLVFAGLGWEMSVTVWFPLIFLFYALGGIIALLLYDGKNFVKGSWNLAKTGFLVAAMITGYIALLAYIFFIPSPDNVPNRT